MKNLKNVMSVITLALVMLVSVNINAQNISNLHEDENFKSYVDQQIDFFNNIDKNSLRKINLTKVIENNQVELIYKVFSVNEKEFIDFVKSQNNKLNKISIDYNFNKYSDSELNKNLEVSFLRVYAGSVSTIGMGNNCKRRYNNALAINFGVAVGAHIAYGTADITVILGVICHGAVAISHASANDNAYLDYLDCLK